MIIPSVPLATMIGASLLSGSKKIIQGSMSKKGVFVTNSSIVRSSLLRRELEQANKGFKNGSLEGVELCGNSYSLWQLLEDKSISTIITSPPYYKMRDYGNKLSKEVGAQKTREEYVNSLVQMFVDLKPKLKDNGVIIVDIDATAKSDTEKVRGIPEEFVAKMERNGFRKKFNLIWEKKGFGRHNSVETPGKNFEYIYGFVKKGEKNINFNQLLIPKKNSDEGWRISLDVFEENSVQHTKWSASDTERFIKRFPNRIDAAVFLSENGYKHPAPINPRVAWRLIQYFSSPGDIILDPFSGAGTINIVAKQLGRKAVGFELNTINSMISVIGEDFSKGNSIENMHKSMKIAGKPKSANYMDSKGPIEGSYHPKKASKYNPEKTMWINTGSALK